MQTDSKSTRLPDGPILDTTAKESSWRDSERRLVVNLRKGWAPFADQISGIMRDAADEIERLEMNQKPPSKSKAVLREVCPRCGKKFRWTRQLTEHISICLHNDQGHPARSK